MTEVLKTLTRPVLTLIGLMAWLVFIAYEVPYPDWFQWTVIGMISSWFGERTIRRLAGK